MRQMLDSMPFPEAKAIYLMERVAAIEDQILNVLELAGDEGRELIFKRRPELRELYERTR